jgi:hypothetical protein
MNQDALGMPMASHVEDEAIQALEALIIGNPELDELELLLAEFNIFDALGAVRQELRHSDFLAFLLDPSQNHGLGDAFVTRLLQAVLLAARGAHFPVAPLDLDVWSLDEITVQREWQHIDILLVHAEHRLAVVIENKVGSEEHSDQLARYHDIVRRSYPAATFFGIYLTPDGEPPTHPEYLPCSYKMVAETIQNLMESRKSTMGEDVRMILRHYHQMLHRHIMSDSQIADLCQRIYRKHQRALDLIFEHRPDLQAVLSTLLRELVESTPGLRLASSSKALVRFVAEPWETVPWLESSATPTGWLLYFEFYNGPNQLTLSLYIGPGPQEKRRRVLDVALAAKAAKPSNEKLGEQWKTLRNWRFLRKEMYESASAAELMDRVRERWSQFAKEDLPPILSELSPDRLTGEPYPGPTATP